MNKNEQAQEMEKEDVSSAFSDAEEGFSEDQNNVIGAYPEEVGECLPEYGGNEAREKRENEGEGGDDLRLSGEKEEYRRLIKTRFKDFYQEDAQKLINRRFRKYKELEERCGESERKLSEAEAALSDLRERFEREIEKAVKETEDRVLNSVRQRRLRPAENGVAQAVAFGKSEVSSLTKSERANIAKRAANGEKISF